MGTVNLDYRSLYLNFEDTACVADPKFAGEVSKMFEADLPRPTIQPRSESTLGSGVSANVDGVWYVKVSRDRTRRLDE